MIRGKAKWFRAVGKPMGGYPNGTGPEEWTFDLIPDDESKDKLLKLGMSKKYLKTNQDGEEYVKFSRKALRRDGAASQPFRIVDHNGNPWDDRLVGNDSTINVQVVLNEVGTGKEKRLKPSALAIQIWDLVAYKPKSVFDTREVPEAASEEWA